jgi:hypothetical protein
VSERASERVIVWLCARACVHECVRARARAGRPHMRMGLLCYREKGNKDLFQNKVLWPDSVK